MISYDDINLKSGAHASREQGTCFMEAAAWIAGAKHSDAPDCVCSTLGAFLRNWNDSLNDTDRQKLKPYLRLVIGTANDGFAERRSWMACDWLIRTFTPAWLDKAGLHDHASELRGFAELTDKAGVLAVMPALNAAWAAAWNAVGAAAWVAAWDAVGAAAGAAVGATAGVAAGAAAGVAVGVAARDAAWAAAWNAAVAAAWVAAGVALQETVVELQDSAFQLLDRMLMLGLESRELPVYEIANEPKLMVEG